MELQRLEEVARECGKLTLKIRDEGLRATDKEEMLGAHIVTEADPQSQELGLAMLTHSHPQEIILAEEQDNDPTVPQDCTVFDPVDGTTRFYNGGREFGVTLATLRAGAPQYGVIYFPADDVMVSAERSGGWFVNGTKQDPMVWNRPIDKTMIGTDIGPWYAREVLDGIARDGFTVMSMLAAVYGARAVVFRETGAYYNLGVAKIWDAAAGCLIIEEAGGKTCDPWGGPLQWDQINMDWVAAANEELAQTVLRHTSNWSGRKGAN